MNSTYVTKERAALMEGRAVQVFLLLLILSTVVVAQERSATNLLFIVDGSNSMWGQIEGQAKIEIVQNVLSQRIENLSDDVNAGLIVYGHRQEADCKDIETLVEMQPLDRAKLLANIRRITPRGKTPIAFSIERAVGAIKNLQEKATIILMTDGRETCSLDPCGHVRKLREEFEFDLHVVGFDIVSEEDARQLRCLAEVGGGRYFTAATIEGLDDAFQGATSRSGAAAEIHRAQENTEIVLDVSASMERPFEGTTRFAAAKNALEKVLKLQVADRDNLAFRRFGGSCGEVEINTRRILDFAQNNAPRISQSLSSQSTGGDTTLVDAISEAAKDFEPRQRFEGVHKRVVIITGGIDPCYQHDEASSLVRQRLESRQIQPQYRFIGIDIPPDHQQQLHRIADATTGEVTFVKTQAELEDVLRTVLEVEPVYNDINAIVGNLNELIDLIGIVIGRIEARDYSDAAKKIDDLPKVAQRVALPFRDLSRRKSDEDFQQLFNAARQLSAIQLEMIETVKALLAHHQGGDKEAYNNAARSYNSLTKRYVGSVEDAERIKNRLLK